MIRLGKSEEDFQELFRTQHQRVRRMLQGMTGNAAVADELTQESFLKAWKGLAFFGLRSSLKTWVYQVALNTGRDWLRSHKNTTPLTEVDTATEALITPEQRAIQEALLKLKDDVRELLVLHYYEGLDLKEIAGVLDIPIGTVKSRLFTAKGLLREELLNKGFDV